TRVSPSIILKRVLMRVGQHGLGAAAFHRVVPFLAENRWLDREMPKKEVLVPRIIGWTRVPEQGCFLRGAIIPQGLVESDDKPRQGRGVAKGVQGREPGHAALAIVGFLSILGPQAENGHAQVGVPLDRNKDG